MAYLTQWIAGILCWWYGYHEWIVTYPTANRRRRVRVCQRCYRRERLV